MIGEKFALVFALAAVMTLTLPQQARCQAVLSLAGPGANAVRDVASALHGAGRASAVPAAAMPVMQPVAAPPDVQATRVLPAMISPVVQPFVFASPALVSPGGAPGGAGVRPPAVPSLPAGLSAPSAGTGSLPLLPSFQSEGSPAVIPTDKTPRPIVKLPPVGPAAVLYLSSSAVKGQTLVFTSRRYALCFVDLPGSYIQAQGGTALEVTGVASITIKEGTALICSGRDALLVSTGIADVGLAPESAAVIAGGPFEPASVMALSSKALDGIKVSLVSGGSVATDGRDTFVVSPASELVAADHPLAAEDLIATHGVERTYRRTLLDDGRWHVVSFGLDAGAMVTRHPLIVAATGSAELSRTQPIRALLDKYKEPAGKPATLTEKQAVAPEDLLEISYSHPVAVPGVRAFRHADLEASGAGGCLLKRGTLFVEARQAVRIDTAVASVLAAPGSVLIVSADKSHVQVLDLLDRRSGDVKVVAGKTSLPLNPGTEVRVLAGATFHARRLALGDGIGRRRVRAVAIGNEYRAVINEFSIPDALVTHPLLRRLPASSDLSDRLLLGRIVKTAAALAYATNDSREAFSSQVMP